VLSGQGYSVIVVPGLSVIEKFGNVLLTGKIFESIHYQRLNKHFFWKNSKNFIFSTNTIFT
jgi:hypothetical protein